MNTGNYRGIKCVFMALCIYTFLAWYIVREKIVNLFRHFK
jgi:hypothetical protein